MPFILLSDVVDILHLVWLFYLVTRVSSHVLYLQLPFSFLYNVFKS